MKNNENHLQQYSTLDEEGRKFIGYFQVNAPTTYIYGSFIGYSTTKISTLENTHTSHIFSMLGKATVYEILAEALKNTYKTWQHSEEYIGILEQNMTDEEYENASNAYEELSTTYARKPRKLSSSEIAIASKLVLEAIGEEMGSDEISEVLNLDVPEVEHALNEHIKAGLNV